MFAKINMARSSIALPFENSLCTTRVSKPYYTEITTLNRKIADFIYRDVPALQHHRQFLLDHNPQDLVTSGLALDRLGQVGPSTVVALAKLSSSIDSVPI